MPKAQNVSKAISYKPTINPGSYFLLPCKHSDDGTLYIHIREVYGHNCDIAFGNESSTGIKFDKDACERLAAFMTELAQIL